MKIPKSAHLKVYLQKALIYMKNAQKQEFRIKVAVCQKFLYQWKVQANSDGLQPTSDGQPAGALSQGGLLRLRFAEPGAVFSVQVLLSAQPWRPLCGRALCVGCSREGMV